MKKIILVIILIGVILGAYFIIKNTKEEVVVAPVRTDNNPVDTKNNIPQIQFFSPLKESMDLKTVTNTEFCFGGYSLSRWNDGSFHMDEGGQLYLKVSGLKATGDFSFRVGDGWNGTFEGTLGAFDPVNLSRVIEGSTDIESEGSVNKTKVKLFLDGKKNQIELNMNLDGIMDIGGDQKYIFDAINCSEWKEWEGVNQELRHMEMSPDYVVLNYDENTGYLITSYFPDVNGKFTQQKKNFSYTTNDKHEVVDLKIK